MIKKVFQSLHESVKKRNTPDSFIPPRSEQEVIHRGIINQNILPIRYDFMPDGKTKNSGSHIYSFNDGGSPGVVEITHSYSPKKSGHETISKITFEMNEGKPLDYMETYRGAILPSILHHISSHAPDILHFSRSIKHADDILRRVQKQFDMVVKESPEGKIVLGKRKIDPKVSRVTDYILKRINKKNKESKNANRRI